MLCPEVAVEVERRALKLVIDADSELVSAGEGMTILLVLCLSVKSELMVIDSQILQDYVSDYINFYYIYSTVILYTLYTIVSSLPPCLHSGLALILFIRRDSKFVLFALSD